MAQCRQRDNHAEDARRRRSWGYLPSVHSHGFFVTSGFVVHITGDHLHVGEHRLVGNDHTPDIVEILPAAAGENLAHQPRLLAVAMDSALNHTLQPLRNRKILVVEHSRHHSSLTRWP